MRVAYPFVEKIDAGIGDVPVVTDEHHEFIDEIDINEQSTQIRITAFETRPRRERDVFIPFPIEPDRIRGIVAEHGKPVLLLSTRAARRQLAAIRRALPGVAMHIRLKSLPEHIGRRPGRR